MKAAVHYGLLLSEIQLFLSIWHTSTAGFYRKQAEP